jgi:hypothetical protein
MTLEKRQRQFEDSGLNRFEREFLGALRQCAARSEFVLPAISGLRDFLFDDHPSAT